MPVICTGIDFGNLKIAGESRAATKVCRGSARAGEITSPAYWLACCRYTYRVGRETESIRNGRTNRSKNNCFRISLPVVRISDIV